MISPLEFYKMALDHEKKYPQVITEAYLRYAELIVKLRMHEQYDFVREIVLKRIKHSSFPIEKYKAFSMLSIIYAYMGKKKEAGEFSILADKNASAETSGLRYHKFLGIVTARDEVLDKW